MMLTGTINGETTDGINSSVRCVLLLRLHRIDSCESDRCEFFSAHACPITAQGELPLKTFLCVSFKK